MDTLTPYRAVTKRGMQIVGDGWRAIPTKEPLCFTLGTTRWTLQLARNIRLGEQPPCDGLCSSKCAVILLNTNVTPARRWEVFWHEAAHAADAEINFSFGSYDQESLAIIIERLMHWLDLSTLLEIADYLGVIQPATLPLDNLRTC